MCLFFPTSCGRSGMMESGRSRRSTISSTKAFSYLILLTIALYSSLDMVMFKTFRWWLIKKHVWHIAFFSWYSSINTLFFFTRQVIWDFRISIQSNRYHWLPHPHQECHTSLLLFNLLWFDAFVQWESFIMELFKGQTLQSPLNVLFTFPVL